MKELARTFFEQGYSCSESVLKAAAEKGYIQKNLIKLATAFSGGMSSGCLCGALAGAQLVISANLGRCELLEDSSICKATAKNFLDKFKEKHHASCCKALSAKYEFHSLERRKNCANLVVDATEIVEEILKEKINV
jgi:C_GCAxxG_C_C family probable redox protein